MNFELTQLGYSITGARVPCVTVPTAQKAFYISQPIGLALRTFACNVPSSAALVTSFIRLFHFNSSYQMTNEFEVTYSPVLFHLLRFLNLMTLWGERLRISNITFFFTGGKNTV